MSLTRFIYPIDFTALLNSNKTLGEEHTIGVGRYRTVVPNKGAFYADSLVIKRKSNGQPLERGRDYECLYTYNDLIRQASGKEVVGAIVIHNESVESEISLDYQFVGGPYSSSTIAIQQAIDALSLDERDVLFENLINTPDYYIPAPHVHDIGDVFGFEYIITMLASIREAVLIGDNAVNNTIKASIEALEAMLTQALQNHLNDFGNPHNTTAHQVGTYNAEEIDTELQRIADEYATLAPQFADLIQQIQVINNEIGAVNGILSSQASTLAIYQNGLNALDLSIAATNQRLASAEQEIDTLKDENLARIQDINTINTAIAAINGVLSSHDSRLNDIEGALPGINSAIQTNASDIGSLEDRADALETRASDLESSVSDLQTSLGDYVEWDDVVNSSALTGNGTNNKILRNINHTVMMPRYVNYANNDSSGARLQWSVSYNSSVGAYTHYCSQRINVIDVYIRSDMRDKTNVSKITPVKADSIMGKIGEGLRYQLKGARKYTAGLSAQIVQKYFKEAVVPIIDEETKQRRLTITQSAIMGLLFSAYQFIREKVSSHDKRLAEQAKLIAKMQKQIDTLQAELKKRK